MESTRTTQIEDDSDWSRGRLSFWLQLDSWTKDQAAALLLNIDPDGIRYDESDNDLERRIILYFELDGLFPIGLDEDEIQLKETRRRLRDVIRVAESAPNSEVMQKRSPAEWIEWARVKRLSIPWLNWARAKNLLDGGLEIASPSDAIDKPLAQRERTSLLVMIAAIAKALDIDVSQPSKAAITIESLTIQLGARVAARTVEEHLKKIPDAIERRLKA